MAFLNDSVTDCGPIMVRPVPGSGRAKPPCCNRPFANGVLFPDFGQRFHSQHCLSLSGQGGVIDPVFPPYSEPSRSPGAISKNRQAAIAPDAKKAVWLLTTPLLTVGCPATQVPWTDEKRGFGLGLYPLLPFCWLPQQSDSMFYPLPPTEE